MSALIFHSQNSSWSMRLSAPISRFVFLLSTLLIPAFCFAYDPDMKDSATTNVAPPVTTDSSKAETFNAGDLIMEHISDNHEWHVYGKIFIPLPVIVKTDKGFECFSSANFRNPGTKELQPYQGKNYAYKLVKGKIVV